LCGPGVSSSAGRVIETNPGSSGRLPSGLVRTTSGPVTFDLTNLLSADDAGVAVLRSFADRGIRLVGVSPYMTLLLKSERRRESR